MRVCITGANGKLGREVLKLLPLALPLVRKPSGLKNERVVDFSNAARLRESLADCGALIHLAGSMKFYDVQALYEGNVLLTQNLLHALPTGARMVFASSISIYGKNIPGTADESTPGNPDSNYAKTKYEAERMVLGWKNSVALRLGPVYGPQYEDYARFLRLIKKGRMVIFGDGKNPVSFVHVSDAAKAVKNALRAKPGVYVVSGESVQQEKIYEIAAKELGVKPPRMRIPLLLAVFLARLEEIRASIFKKRPFITVEHINILGKSRTFNCAKAKKELKFKPMPIAKGIKEIARSAGF